MARPDAQAGWAGTLEGGAVIAAALDDPFADAVEVLAAAGIDGARWVELRAACDSTLVADAEARARYAGEHAHALAAFQAGQLPTEVVRKARDTWSRGTVVAPPRAEPDQAATNDALGALGTPRPQPALHPAAVPRASPWAPASPSAPQAADAGFPVRAASDLDTTGETFLVLEPVLPFSGRNEAPPPSSATSAVIVQSGDTAALRVEDIRAALPFGRDSAHAPAAAPRTAAAARSALDETSALGVLVFEPPLPFVPHEGIPPPSTAAALPPHEAMGETAFHTAIVIEDPLPFKAADGPPRSTRSADADAASPAPADGAAMRLRSVPLTLRQLAAVYCEIQRQPDSRPAVLAHHRLTPEQEAAAGRELGELLAQSHAARDAWTRSCDEYRAWWRAGCGRGA